MKRHLTRKSTSHFFSNFYLVAFYLYRSKTFLSLFLIFVYHVSTSQNWIQIQNFPASKRDDGVAVTVNNKAYFGTGLQEGWTATIDFYELDIPTLAWKKIPDMPHSTERQYACAFPGKNCFYIFGGDGIGGALNNLYKYDIASSSWIQMNSKPGNGLRGASCMAFGDSIIFVGGSSNTSINNEVWLYVLSSNTWTKRNNFSYGGRWRACASVLNNKGYFMFGLDSNNIYRKEIFKYNLVADTWMPMSDFPSTIGRTYSSLVTASQQLVLFGGTDSLKNYFNDTWYYNDVTNKWIKDQTMPSFGRKGGMCASDGLHIYYSCGINKLDQRLNETWMTDIPLSLENEKQNVSFQIYPNPAFNEINLIFSDAPLDNFSYRVLSTNGFEVVSFQKINQSPTKINLSQLNSGIYFLEIKNEKGFIEIRKLIKE